MNDYTYKLPTCNLEEVSMVKRLRSNPTVVAKTLPNIVRNYSKRQLTDNSDVLNAFAGVTNMLLDQCGVELCFGLIKSALCPQLVSPSPRFLRRRAGFPSWSWVGWEGEAWLSSVTSWYVDEAEWIAKYSWIDWYMYTESDGIGEFHLVPQSKWKPGMVFGEGLSPNSSEVNFSKEMLALSDTSGYMDNMEVLNKFLRLAAAASEGGDVGSEAQALDKYLGNTGRIQNSILHAARSKHGTGVNSKVLQAFDGAPKYQDFLKKIPPPESESESKQGATNSNPPATIDRKDIKSLSPDTTIPIYALLFRTLSSYIWMSVYSPDNKKAAADSNHVYLYAGKDRYIGVAWLCSQRLHTHISLFPTGLPTHMVVLSGPDNQESLATAWGVSPKKEYGRKGIPEKFYRVMILGLQDQATGKMLGDSVREKVGVGEVMADALENMGPNELFWDQVLLQ
jgi:hypothetical protein